MATSAQAPEDSSPVPLEGVTVDSRRGSESREPDGAEEYLKQRRQSQEEWSRQRDTLNRLRSWHDWDQGRRTSLTRFCLSKLRLSKRPARPNDDECISLATYYFPLRKDLKVNVCDFGGGRYKESEHSLTAIRSVWNSKPEWATVRWIHIPIGPGDLASNLQQSFLHSGSKEINREQPYHQCEVLSLRSFRQLQDQIDVIKILSLSNPRLEIKLSDRDRNFREESGWNNSMAHPSSRFRFWDEAFSDLPSLLTEGDYRDPHLSTLPQVSKSNNQTLSQHPAYTQLILVRDTFRTFDRKDGFLLTMSPVSDVSSSMKLLDFLLPSVYLGGINNGLEWLKRHSSPEHDSWEEKCVKWLRARILMELEGNPSLQYFQQITTAYIPDVPTAYTRIVRNLRRRQTLPLKRYESVELVREYANCMNEISCIYDMSEQKIRHLDRLRREWSDYEMGHVEGPDTVAEGPSAKPQSVRMSNDLSERIEKWTAKIKTDHEHLPRLLEDLKNSLDVLFQIRTMEQNELTLMAESNNRAILVFTVVTIIFLPLSFFTSYFGMNIRGIADTDKTERYFWAVCGSVTTFVVGLTIVFGFKERLRSWILDRIWED